MAHCHLGFTVKEAAVTDLAKCIGANNANSLRRQPPQSFAKPCKAGQGAASGILIKVTIAVEPGGQ
jgi:hypothetical protein